MERGDHKQMQSGDGRITLTVWKDSKDVRIVSTNAGGGTAQCERRIGKEKKKVPERYCHH